MSATVEIVDVYPDAVRVAIETIRPGDSVFGPCGERDRVRLVRTFPHVTRITPETRWPLTLANGSPVTIIREDTPR